MDIYWGKIVRRELLSGLIGFVVLVTGSTSGAIEPELKCEAAKNTVAGEYNLCRLKADAKAVRKSESPDYSACDDQFAKKWTKAENRATKAGATCSSSGDLAEVQSMITDQAGAIAAALTGAGLPVCGDDSVNAVGEQCDGVDLGALGCTDLGFTGGVLACDGGCGLDTSQCSVPTAGEFGDLLVGTSCNGADFGGGCTSAETGYHYKGAFDGYQCWWHTKNQAWNTSYSSSSYNDASQVGAWGWCGGTPFSSGGFVCFEPLP
jgi:hypothetical protein